MKICLIGMSGSGKTYWSRKLGDLGFQRISCDEQIEEGLRAQSCLQGSAGIQSVAHWLGQPYTEGYPERQELYLAAEARVVQEILKILERGAPEDLAIDTTGSVVYTGEEICRRLAALSTVVYLETSAGEFEIMFQRYLHDPKPVVWGDCFRRLQNETNEEAMSRCYRDLLQFRRSLYLRYAKVTIPTALLWRQEFDGEAFLGIIRETSAKLP